MHIESQSTSLKPIKLIFTLGVKYEMHIQVFASEDF